VIFTRLVGADVRRRTRFQAQCFRLPIEQGAGQLTPDFVKSGINSCVGRFMVPMRVQELEVGACGEPSNHLVRPCAPEHGDT